MTVRDEKIIKDANEKNIPIFVLTAKDKLSYNTIADYYHSSCINANCSKEFLDDLKGRIQEFKQWQEDNKEMVKIPD